MDSLKNIAVRPVGLVGLGAMGRGVAENLVRKGFPLVGYDIRPEAGEWLRGQGGRFAPDLASLPGPARSW